jgi:hypothetical protein
MLAGDIEEGSDHLRVEAPGASGFSQLCSCSGAGEPEPRCGGAAHALLNSTNVIYG